MALHYVSTARLKPYLELCEEEDTALRLHNEAMLTGASLLSVIALIEIAMRNRLHAQIGMDFGEANWLLANPCPIPLQHSEKTLVKSAFNQARKDKFSKLSKADQRALDALAFPKGRPADIQHNDLMHARRKAVPISEGELIAHTTIFFWKRFFAPEYEPSIWTRSAKRLFPNKKLARKTVSEQIEVIYKARNRLAHHEPMHGPRLIEAIEAVDFVRHNMDSRFPNPDGPVARFTQRQFDELTLRKAQFFSDWLQLTGKKHP